MRKFILIGVVAAISTLLVGYFATMRQIHQENQSAMIVAKSNVSVAVAPIRKSLDDLESYLIPEWELGYDVVTPLDYKDLRPDVRDLKDRISDLERNPSQEKLLEFQKHAHIFSNELKQEDGKSLGIGPARYEGARKSVRVFSN